MSSRYVVPNYMKPTKSSTAHRSVRANYLEREKDRESLVKKKQEVLIKVAKELDNNDIDTDGYPKDREKVIEQLEECRWKLIELQSALNTERSKLTPKKVSSNVSKVEASRGVKTDDSAKDLQQWYTIDELAEECIEKFKIQCKTVWEDQNVYYVEPSAGEGDILLKLPEGRRKGVDLEPKNDKLKATMERRKKSENDIIEKKNFFETTRENLGVRPDQPLVLIGNPPFGDVASQFFDHATANLKADYIAWILPNSFLSRGKRNRIDPHYHLIYVMNITCCYVHKGKLFNLATMFGIWKRETIPLLIPQTVLGNSDFELITEKSKKTEIKDKKWDVNGDPDNNKYFWMRKVVQHIKNKPQAPTHETAQSLIDTYNNSKNGDDWKEKKLLESFCIKCRTPELYEKVYKFFSEYDWANHIGQFASGRSKKDWEPPTRIIISKTMLYSAYNNDLGFRPYEDIPGFAHRLQTTLQGPTSINAKKSDITRASVANKYSGGRRKKRTKKKARKKRKKRTRRK
jgi:hypothetical protein